MSRKKTILNRRDIQAAKELLLSSSPLERAVLIAFYADGKSREQICEELLIDHEIYRRIKASARARFSSLRSGIQSTWACHHEAGEQNANDGALSSVNARWVSLPVLSVSRVPPKFKQSRPY